MFFFVILLLIVVGLLVALLPLALLVFWIWMLVDCASNKKLPDIQRAIWLFVIIVTGAIGALIYFFVGRSPKTYIAPRYYRPRARQRTSYKQQPAVEHSYQEGYRSQEVHRSYQDMPAASTEQAAPEQQQAEYEQIRISYPETF